MRVNKFQQFHSETFVNYELTDKRGRNNQLQLLFSTAERRVSYLHTIDP
jgi:hypothetical protein